MPAMSSGICTFFTALYIGFRYRAHEMISKLVQRYFLDHVALFCCLSHSLAILSSNVGS
jgi:hypothetical protein